VTDRFPGWMRDTAREKRFAALQRVFTRLPDEGYETLRRTRFIYWWTGPHLSVGAIILAEDALFFFLSDGLEARPQEYANYAVGHEWHTSFLATRADLTPSGTAKPTTAFVGVQDPERDELKVGNIACGSAGDEQAELTRGDGSGHAPDSVRPGGHKCLIEEHDSGCPSVAEPDGSAVPRGVWDLEYIRGPPRGCRSGRETRRLDAGSGCDPALARRIWREHYLPRVVRFVDTGALGMDDPRVQAVLADDPFKGVRPR